MLSWWCDGVLRLAPVLLIMHISDCIIIITSLPSLPGPDLLSVGPHAGPGETLDHPDCDGSYLSSDGPITAKLRLAWPQSRPMGAQCQKMSWLHLNFLLSIKIYTYSVQYTGTLQSKLFYASPAQYSEALTRLLWLSPAEPLHCS